MVQLWVLIGLIVSAFAVSLLGAAFSIVGIGKLFTGAVLAVWLMAGALELAKFVIAAFLHQVWEKLNFLLKVYLLISVVVLSVITSMGIFGFLSDAYQESSFTLETAQVKLDSLQAEKLRNEQEVARINKSIDEIPANRITRKMKAREEAAPILAELAKDADRIAKDITAANLSVIEVKNKVGPLIYIARAFNMDIDQVVKYQIFLFVFVFDPLAICLVIAVSEAQKRRRQEKEQEKSAPQNPTHHPGEEKLAKAAQSLKMRFAAEEKQESG